MSVSVSKFPLLVRTPTLLTSFSLDYLCKDHVQIRSYSEGLGVRISVYLLFGGNKRWLGKPWVGEAYKLGETRKGSPLEMSKERSWLKIEEGIGKLTN